MHNGRNLARKTAVNNRCVQSGQRPWPIISDLQKEKKKVEGRQDFWSIMGDYRYPNHVAPRMELCSEGRFPDTSEHWCTACEHHHWNIDGDESLSEPWIGVTRSNCSTKIHQKHIRGCKAEWRWNRSQQDQEYIWPQEWSSMLKNSQ